MLFRRFTSRSGGRFCGVFSQRDFPWIFISSLKWWPTGEENFDDFSPDSALLKIFREKNFQIVWQQHQKDQTAQPSSRIDSCYIQTIPWLEGKLCLICTSRDKKLTQREDDEAVMKFFRTRGRTKGEIPSHRRCFEWCLISNHWNWFFDTYTLS